LPVLHVFELTAATKYQLVFGPTTQRSAVAVIEYIDDFLTENGQDLDGDGFGSRADVVVTPCTPPAGFAPNARDCDDTNSLINPGTAEVCDGVDQNCNGISDDVGLACRVGEGRCRVEGRTQCAAEGEVVVCSAVPLTATLEACNGLDDDCNGEIDEADWLCPDPARPTCVRSAMSAVCGCQLDLDCGSANSGRICNVDKGVCEDGCSLLPGNNGCGDGATCSRERCVPIVTAAGVGGGAGLAAAQGGASGDASEPAATSEGGEGAVGAVGSRSATSRGGCDCTVVGRRGASESLAALGIACLALWLRRPRAFFRRVTALATAWLMFGCGGRVRYEAASSASGDDAGEGGTTHEHPHDDGGRASAASGSGGMGGDADRECRMALGHELVEHACSHVTNGPFVQVVAGGGISPPDVSDLHHTYEVQVVGDGARLHYRAQRTGEHAFMSDVPGSWSVSQSGRLLPSHPSFPVDGCPHLTRAAVFQLEKGAEYELQWVASSSEVELFVEHLGAFGVGAWDDACNEEIER
jgi:hypothetical protein